MSDHTFVYKSKKVVDGVKLPASRLLEMIDGWDFEDEENGNHPYTFLKADDQIEVLVSGKKVPLNKVTFVLRNPKDHDPDA